MYLIQIVENYFLYNYSCFLKILRNFVEEFCLKKKKKEKNRLHIILNKNDFSQYLSWCKFVTCKASYHMSQYLKKIFL